MYKKLRKINLFIPGAAKSGTSTLHELLKFHPDVNMANRKEPHFFSSPDINLNDKKKIQAYLKNFDFSKNYKYHGESSTGYFYFDEFKTNLKKYGSVDAKFILILRNPIDRTISHYNYLKSLGSEDSDFDTAILKNKSKAPTTSDLLPEYNVKNYYQYSLYGKWVEKYFNTFKTENIKIITFEELIENQLETINSCFNFLGLEELDELPDMKMNKTVKLRFPKLYRKIRIFALNKSQSRDIVKHFIPKSIRRKYKNAILDLILRIMQTNKTMPSIYADKRKMLKNLLEEDVLSLKAITGRAFNEWPDFKND